MYQEINSEGKINYNPREITVLFYLYIESYVAPIFAFKEPSIDYMAYANIIWAFP